MTETEIKELVAVTIKDVFKEEFGAYQIEREKHYQQHLWIDRMMDFTTRTRNQALAVVVMAIVGGFFTLLFLGFVVWGQKKF